MRKNDTFLNAQMGDYRLQEILAVGGMSRVYLGIDVKLERRAAVKVLELEQTWVDDTIIQRFEREAKAVAALEHDNIITIYQYGQYEGAYFLAMQYIDGKDLRILLKDYRKKNQQMPQDRGFKIMQQVAAALDFAHKAGIVHRDIKPSNVLITGNDKAILTDFGLVLTETDATLGTAFGTPRYIAPEQAVASQQAVPQSDIYALAVIFYEILTGDTPFTGETPMEIALAHVSDPPDPPSERNPDIPKAVDEVLLKALSKEPTERHQTATEMVNAVIEAFGKEVPEIPKPSAEKKPAAKTTPAAPKKPTLPKPSEPAAVPSPLEDGRTIPVEKRRSPIPLLLLLIILLVGGAGGYMYYTDSLPPQIASLLPIGNINEDFPDEIVLIYNDTSLVIHNNTDEDFRTLQQGQGVEQLQLVRGEPDADRDDWNGDRVPQDIIRAGNCFRLGLQEVEFEPDACDATPNFENLTNRNLFFWRTSPSERTFEVRWGGEVIRECPTVGERGQLTCQFAKPGGE